MNINIIKFGGSVISDNSRRYFNSKNTVRLAKELYPYRKGTILVHGTGHVGKPPALKYGYVKNGIISKEDKLIALEIKSRIRQLNMDVVHALLSVSIPAMPIDLLHFYSYSETNFNFSMIEMTIRDLLKNDIIPVFYGDLLPEPDGSFKVFSSDLLTLLLTKMLKPENVIFLCNVDGVYKNKAVTPGDPQQVIIKELTQNKMASINWFVNDDLDVSGGMRKKAECALEISHFCKRCFIGSGYAENILSKVLNGDSVEGTFIKPD